MKLQNFTHLTNRHTNPHRTLLCLKAVSQETTYRLSQKWITFFVSHLWKLSRMIVTATSSVATPQTPTLFTGSHWFVSPLCSLIKYPLGFNPSPMLSSFIKSHSGFTISPIPIRSSHLRPPSGFIVIISPILDSSVKSHSGFILSPNGRSILRIKIKGTR